MALTYAVYEDANAVVAGADVTTASRTYDSGALVSVIWIAGGQNPSFGDVSITNSGTAQTWNDITAIANADSCYIRAWYCVMSTTQAMTISVASTDAEPLAAVVYTIAHAGQHATTPVPAGNIFGGLDTDGDVSQSITPTSTGSCLWLACGDWDNDTDTYVAAADCTKVDTYPAPPSFVGALFRPTTQPRADASAFTIGETDTNGKVTWIAFEVQAAAGGPTFTPRSMLLGVG